MSPSGRPFLTPSGHRPAWSQSSSVQWAAGDAFDPASYRSILQGRDGRPPVSAVVSTIGILLEGNYKGQSSSLSDTFQALTKGWGLGSGNPLAQGSGQPAQEGMYEKMNRDAALSVARTWLDTMASESFSLAKETASSSSRPMSPPPPPFIFISAEDIFRPIVDPRYLSSKRQAEQRLEAMSWDTSYSKASSSSSSSSSTGSPSEPDADGAGLAAEIDSSPPPDAPNQRRFRPVFIRPGVMYHPHTRPISTLPSALLDLSTAIHSYLPSSAPTPANLLRLAAQEPLARLLTLSPLHIDTVAKAVGQAVDRSDVQGVVDTQRIKALAGWKDVGSASPFAEGTTSHWPTMRM